MAEINFTEVYMPDYAELGQQQLYETRERLVDFIRIKFPDIDVVPNTVVGDLIVTPQAWTLSALEEGLTRVFSDLNTENIANGVVYNCDFVEKWLGNFINGPDFVRPMSGVIRMVFNSPEAVVLDRSTQFRLKNSIFTIYLPYNGSYVIMPPGQSVPDGTNGTTLIDTGSQTYFCDIPVISETFDKSSDSIAVSSEAEVSVYLEHLTNSSALVNFDPGYTEYSVVDMAKLIRTTTYSASMNSRVGAIRYIQEACPFVESVYPILSGDRECLRSYRNDTGVATGCMDLYVRSKSYEFTEKQTVRLYLNTENDSWEGQWNYAGQPYHLESVTCSATPTVADIPCTIVSSSDDGLCGMSTYTSAEKFFISIPDTKGNDGDSIYMPRVEEVVQEGDARQYVDFVITYQTDPMLRPIEQTAENKDYAPLNVDIMTRGFIPVIIDNFEVEYTRQAGIVPDLEYAMTEIKIYLSKLGAPDVFAEGEIARIMQEAGAKYTKRINVLAHVQWSIATHIINLKGERIPVPQTPAITTSAGLRVQYPNEEMPISPDEMFACSVRNVRYYLMEHSVKFKEVKDI